MNTRIAALIGTLILSSAGIASADSPRFDADGVYRIPFGTAAAPILACSPDKVCSIQLEANEKVLDKVSGDTVRWQIVTGVAGSRANVPMIFFKPVDVGTVVDPIQTNLIITTDRRIYEMRLQAVKSVSRTRYGFTYGGKNLSTSVSTPVAAAISGEPQNLSHGANTAEVGLTMGQGMESTGSSLTAMVQQEPSPPSFNGFNAFDHNYRIVGDTDYKPVAAWNDGISTYFQMPRSAPSPSIYIQPAYGSLQIANLHGPINDVYSVTGTPDHIVLIGAIGKKVPHIDIFKGSSH